MPTSTPVSIWRSDADDQRAPARLTPIIGGKATGLVRAGRAGLAVPAWTCVPVDAWHAARIAVPSLDAQALHDHLTDTSWWGELCAWRDEHTDGTVAVRSSALGEDDAAAGASFAGIFASVLHVTDHDALAAAIITCWRSAASTRARAYVAARQLADHATDMAVVVQQMIDAEHAGVAFSHDPATGHDHVVVAIADGTAEQLVDGSDAGSSVTCDRWTGELTPPGIWTRPPRRQLVRAVVEAVLVGEAALGGPADLEWAQHAGSLWVVQLRPATVPLAAPSAIDLTNTEEQYPGTALPLTASATVRLGAHATGQLMRRASGMEAAARLSTAEAPITLDAGRICIDVDRWYALATRWAPRDGGAAWLREAWGLDDPAPVEAGDHRRASRLPPRPVARALVRALLPTRSRRLARARRAPTAASVARQLERVSRSMLRLASVGAAVDYCEPWLARRQRDTADQGPVATAVRDPFMDDLRALHAQLASMSVDSRRRQPLLDRFVARHRAHAPGGLHVDAPRLAEQPDQLLAMLAALDARTGAASAEARRPRRRLLDLVVARREATRRDRAARFAELRSTALAAGRLLVERGDAATPDDAFLLGIDELTDALDGSLDADVLRSLLQRRADAVSIVRSAPAPRRPGLAAVRHAPSTGTIVATGTACIAGSVEGRAVLGVQPDAITAAARGILVCERLTPDSAVWLTAHAALVVERSSPLAHAVIVARELGIPTIVQATDATTRIRPGDRLRVDGTLGTVELR